MPSVTLNNIWGQLPHLETLHIKNVDELNAELFKELAASLISYTGLRTFTLELIAFDIETVKETYLEILKKHSETLTHISLARNKVTNAFVNYIAENFKEMSRIKQITLTHLKECRNLNWVEFLKSIASLSAGGQDPITVVISDY